MFQYIIPKMPSLPLTQEQYERLVEETHKDKNRFVALRDSLMYRIAWETGFRPMEVRCIKIKHIDLKKSKIFIPAENNKEHHSDNWSVSKKVILLILDYLRKTKVHKTSQWLFPSCHNKERKVDNPVCPKQHQRYFTERMQRLGFLHVSFIDGQNKPRYNYNLYSIRKRYGSRVYKMLGCPKKTAIMLRQRDKSLKSVWNYVFLEEAEQASEILGQIEMMENKYKRREIIRVR